MFSSLLTRTLIEMSDLTYGLLEREAGNDKKKWKKKNSIVTIKEDIMKFLMSNDIIVKGERKYESKTQYTESRFKYLFSRILGHKTKYQRWTLEPENIYQLPQAKNIGDERGNVAGDSDPTHVQHDDLVNGYPADTDTGSLNPKTVSLSSIKDEDPTQYTKVLHVVRDTIFFIAVLYRVRDYEEQLINTATNESRLNEEDSEYVIEKLKKDVRLTW